MNDYLEDRYFEKGKMDFIDEESDIEEGLYEISSVEDEEDYGFFNNHNFNPYFANYFDDDDNDYGFFDDYY